MKISILNRFQNAITKMAIPFLVFSLYPQSGPNILKYYALSLTVASVTIFGFPLKINKSLDNKIVYLKFNIIFFIYLILITLIVNYFISIIFHLEYLILMSAGVYFALTHIFISIEKYCQYYSTETKGFIIFFIQNLFLILGIYFGGLKGIQTYSFFLYLLLVSLVVLIIFIFFIFNKNIGKIQLNDIRSFFSNTWQLGQYSVVQNSISKGDTLILTYMLDARMFADYYLITRFIDIGNFVISMFSQLSLIEAYKSKNVPKLTNYLNVSLISLIFSIFIFYLYSLHNNLSFRLFYVLLFLILILKSIFLYYQDLYIYLTKEKYIIIAIYIQLGILLFLMIFIQKFIYLFDIYFYFAFSYIMYSFSLFYLYKNSRLAIEKS
ncbi:hypothetical protein AFK20_00765 [Enhydrobacter aerosaccus]|uniref:Polysaccharide biosynthesis protein n=1 Tax=Enhydrobacter aerosaccus TaxID=225324 RepID=A0ABR5INN9_9HYPH|nr:hypothetical protein [Enhydrobacter aerosaccus]KND22683.1 hypothetical protein AFK20_00765 [Enhydrobacter aerosaccus]